MESVSRAVTNLVIGQLQLLQLDYVLNDDVRVLLMELEKRSAEAQELTHTMPPEASHSLMEWELMRERIVVSLEGIQHVSETGDGLHG